MLLGRVGVAEPAMKLAGTEPVQLSIRNGDINDVEYLSSLISFVIAID